MQGDEPSMRSYFCWEDVANPEKRVERASNVLFLDLGKGYRSARCVCCRFPYMYVSCNSKHCG